mmetsp:Transcript_99574/g.171448  ORF Transcript_99574/g.171448 Transcript_99574/m.171448 type:complete len:237 (-) Transcript_99574:1778-2488(-)
MPLDCKVELPLHFCLQVPVELARLWGQRGVPGGGLNGPAEKLRPLGLQSLGGTLCPQGRALVVSAVREGAEKRLQASGLYAGLGRVPLQGPGIWGGGSCLGDLEAGEGFEHLQASLQQPCPWTLPCGMAGQGRGPPGHRGLCQHLLSDLIAPLHISRDGVVPEEAQAVQHFGHGRAVEGLEVAQDDAAQVRQEAGLVVCAAGYAIIRDQGGHHLGPQGHELYQGRSPVTGSPQAVD